MEIKQYTDKLIVANLTLDDLAQEDTDTLFPENVSQELQKVTNIRVSIPPTADKIRLKLLRENYVFADRMFDTSINLRNNHVDFEKWVRIDTELYDGKEVRDAIREIAHTSFTRDRRFHVGEKLNQNQANIIMDTWIDELPNFFVCHCKGDCAGFLALQEKGNRSAYVHMAAVAAKYRPAGVALSMYAYVVNNCLKQGYKSVTGYVSSGNTPIINLYRFLGASFDVVTDIFLKETDYIHNSL